jgi:uncharacterized protein
MVIKVMSNIKVLLLLLLLINQLFAQETQIELNTATGTIFGTLSFANLKQKMPIVLIVAGSGPTDRDGNNPSMKNNSLKMLANELNLNGIASVRFDKRAIAKSAKAATKEEDLRFETYINDVNDWVKMLAKDKRFSKIIIAGHSEGSLIGMIAASYSKKVNKFISIAGAGSPADEILKEQIAKQTQEYKDIAFPKIDSLKKGLLLKNVNPMLYTLFRPSVQSYLISWFKYNPTEEIAKLKIPILILQGDKDIQVSVNEANKLIKASKNASSAIIPNMNHVLKTIKTLELKEQMKTYSNPELPLNEALISEIVKFIKN